ncbi:MAG: hypothetical protein EXS13_06275 [Planctomycetes bacterium]|nr:hypothetical protein [Planctomycetota bacterium]
MSDSPLPRRPPATSAFVRALGGAIALGLASCRAPPAGVLSAPATADPANYSYAIYDNNDALLHTPIEQLRREIADRRSNGQKPISDVYVLVHGWDFTLEEAFALYEGYRAAIEQRLVDIQRFDPDYQPWFVFVTWSSVSRPLTHGLRSVLPFPPPDLAEGATRLADGLLFHLPSAWGESQDAVRLAMGHPQRWSQVDLQGDGDFEYRRALEAGAARVASGTFAGFEIPVSLLIEELIHLQRSAWHPAPPPALHVVGHSFGGKLASLAAYDAIQRIAARELARGEGVRTDSLLDSLVLIQPAMQASEMYWELPLPMADEFLAPFESSLRRHAGAQWPSLRFEAAAARIGTKVLVHSRHDSANGWVFGVGDLLLDHDAAARAQETMARAQERPLPPPRTFSQRLITFPFDLADRLLQVVVRGTEIVVQTVISDVGAVFDGLAESAEEIGSDVGDPPALLVDLLKVPFSSIMTQRSIGNRGFTRPRSLVSRIDPRTWLDGSAGAWLESSQTIDADEFLALSATLGTPPSPEPGGRYFVADARKVYVGSLPGSWNDIIPPGAHGDLRSTDVLIGPGPIALSKRDRTMNVVYNLTRGPRLARGATDPATLPR